MTEVLDRPVPSLSLQPQEGPEVTVENPWSAIKAHFEGRIPEDSCDYYLQDMRGYDPIWKKLMEDLVMGRNIKRKIVGVVLPVENAGDVPKVAFSANASRHDSLWEATGTSRETMEGAFQIEDTGDIDVPRLQITEYEEGSGFPERVLEYLNRNTPGGWYLVDKLPRINPASAA